MKSKELTCNDCGCRFDIKERKEPPPQAAKETKAAALEARPASVSCPECRSYNVTTA